MLYKPKRKVCPEKSLRYPIVIYNPIKWIEGETGDYLVFGLDGFIVKDKDVSAVFLKYEYKGELRSEAIISKLKENYIHEIRNSLIFARIFKSKVYIFVWPQNFPMGFNTKEKRIYKCEPQFNNGELNFEYELINLDELEKLIKKLRGKSFRFVKNLSSATSYVECYLANKTKNPWPGDLDAVVYSKKTKKIISIIEFKTHNIASLVEEEHIGKYGKQDWRRFNVIDILQKRLLAIQGEKPKCLYLVWGTKNIKEHKKIKVDVIDNKIKIKSIIGNRPPFNKFSERMFGALIRLSNE